MSNDVPMWCDECYATIHYGYVMLVRGRVTGRYCSKRCRDKAEAAVRDPTTREETGR